MSRLKRSDYDRKYLARYRTTLREEGYYISLHSEGFPRVYKSKSEKYYGRAVKTVNGVGTKFLTKLCDTPEEALRLIDEYVPRTGLGPKNPRLFKKSKKKEND